MEETMIPVVLDTMGSLYAHGPVEKTPKGKAIDVKNCKFVGDSVKMRYGMTVTAESQDTTSRITGLTNYVLDDMQYLMTFNSSGRLEREQPEGSGSMHTIVSGVGTGLYADFAQAYLQEYIAFSSLFSPGASASPKVYHRYLGNFYLDPVAALSNNIPITGSTQFGLGDIPIGLRYVMVLFETRSGFISGVTGNAVFPVQITNPDMKIILEGVPIGDETVIRRWIAFTEAGGSSVGPFFYIPETIISQDLNAEIDATKIDNNLDTVVILNFTDDALIGGVDVSDFFDKIILSNQKSVFYSPSTKRMIWTGESDTIFRVSEPDDPQTYFGATSFIQPGQQDGDKAIVAREWRTELYLLKENSGYVTTPSNSNPNEWPVLKRWQGSGPAGPWAVDLSDEMMVFAAKKGLMVYTGSAPAPITESIRDVWDRINWAAGHLIWVTIDHKENEIHVGLPLDNATVPNKRLTVYLGYLDITDQTTHENLKWSIDDIAASREVLVRRTLPASPNPNQPLPALTAFNQTLVLTNDPTGKVNLLDPTSYSDNTNAIEQVWQSSFEAPRKLGIYSLNAIDVMASGTGIIQAFAIGLNSGNMKVIRPIPLDAYVTDHTRKLTAQAERFSIRITNNKQADSSFVLARITLYMRYAWAVRTV